LLKTVSQKPLLQPAALGRPLEKAGVMVLLTKAYFRMLQWQRTRI